MKRTGFRKKTFSEIKEAKASKPKVAKKKRTTGQIKPFKTKLWECCKQIIRLKYGNTCYTCGKTGLEGGGWHTGHFIPSSVGGHSLRYSLDNLRPQCYHCNINLSGNGSQFYRNLVEREGQEYVDNLFKLKNQLIKADEHWYREKIASYTLLLQELQKADKANI